MRKRFKKIDPTLFFVLLLALYPLLKFNLSSYIFIALSAVIIFKSIKGRSFDINKGNLLKFIGVSLYFLLIVLSVLYSENKDDAYKRIIRLLPLLILPVVLVFTRENFSRVKQRMAMNVFIVANMIYMAVLYGVFYMHNSSLGEQATSFVNVLSNHNEFQPILDDYLGYDTLFVHKAYFSMGFVLIAIYALVEALNRLNLNKPLAILYAVVFILFSTYILYVFSFPNVLALILSVLLVIAIRIKRKEISRTATLVLLPIIGLGILFGIYIKSDNVDVLRGINFIKSTISSSEIESNDPRIEIYKSSKEILERSSLTDLLIGHGIGDVQGILNNEYSRRLEEIKGKNLLLFNEEFNDGYWFKNNIEVTPNKEMSPFGGSNADILTELPTDLESSHNISNKIIPENESYYSFSVFAKGDTAKNVILRLGDIDQRAAFDLETGSIKVQNSRTVKARAVPYPNKWFRCIIMTRINTEALVIIGVSNKQNEYIYDGSERSLFLWGAQLEEGDSTTAYLKNKIELLKYVDERHLNTHNTYLYFFMAGGILCVLSFLFCLGYLFYIAIKNENIYQITFCVVICANFLTENVLSRHWGLMFVSLMLITYFLNDKKTIESDI